MNRLTESTDIIKDVDKLRYRLHAEGYVYFKRILPTSQLDEVRHAWLEVLTADQYLDPMIPADALVPRSRAQIANQNMVDLTSRLFALEATHDFARCEVVRAIIQTLLGGEVMLLPAPIAPRVKFPLDWYGPPAATAVPMTTTAHQDFTYTQGAVDTLTMWVPLVDVPMTKGPLSILSGSHLKGPMEFKNLNGCDSLEWVSDDMAVGDALIFHSLTAHRGLPNNSTSIRLSLDFRYQRTSDQVCWSSLLGGPNGWDGIYAGWKSNKNKYFWRQYALSVVPYDMTIINRLHESVVSAAESGDFRALAQMRQVAAISKDSVLKGKALKLLEKSHVAT